MEHEKEKRKSVGVYFVSSYITVVNKVYEDYFLFNKTMNYVRVGILNSSYTFPLHPFNQIYIW